MDWIARLLAHDVYTPDALRAELELFRRLADEHGLRSPQAVRVLNRIVERHVQAAIKLARKYRAPEMELEDWLTSAVFGLITAVERFDVSQPVGFMTYATHWVRYELGLAYHYCAHHIRVSTSADKKSRAGREDIAEMASAARRLVSTQASVVDGVSVQDALEADLESAEASLGTHQQLTVLGRAVANLKTKQRQVLLTRLDGHTLDVAAANLGVSRERARQYEALALAEIRRALGLPAEKRSMSVWAASRRKPATSEA